MIRNTIQLLLAVLFISGTAAAQKDAGVRKLLTPQKTVKTPVNAGFFTQRLGSEPQLVRLPPENTDYYLMWKLNSGVNVIFQTVPKGQYTGFNTSSGKKISGLPFDLVFNSSTFDECRYKFAADKADWVQVTEDAEGAPGYFKLTFKRGGQIIYLAFYGNEKLLKAITISTTELS